MSTYILREGQQAIITRFGKPVGQAVTAAGLHFKLPFVHKVRLLEKRILNWDGEPRQIPTSEKKYISVDTTARWKIIDPLKFIQTVQNEYQARTRLDTILDAETRKVISRHRLVEAVRNTNTILERPKSKNTEEEEVTGRIAKVKLGREKLSQMIFTSAKPQLVSLGIELIDVQLKRISYESSVEQKVYERMISERQRIAEKIRSVGRGESEKIQGRLNKKLQEIKSKAYENVQKIKGAADATAIKIYGDAIKQDPNFYKFVRTLKAYSKGIKSDTKLILSTDSSFFNILQKGP